MDHGKYLKLLLHEASTIFGGVCFLLVILIFPMLGVDSKFISTVTYICALGALYWSSYKICKQYYIKYKDTENRTLNVKQIEGLVKFQTGTGKTFNVANIWASIGITNNSQFGSSITEIRVSGNTGSKKVTLDKVIKIHDSNNEKVAIKSLNLLSGESKVIKIHCMLNSVFTNSVETANYLNENKNLKLVMSYKLMSDNDVQDKTLELNIPMDQLIARFKDEWLRTRQKDALAIIT